MSVQSRSFLLRAVSLLGVAVGMVCAAAQGTPADSTLSASIVVGQQPSAVASVSLPVQTFDARSLQRRGTTSVADALRNVAGVSVRDYGGAGGLKTVSARGFGASHTAVSFNDLPLGDARTGQTDLGRLPLSAFSELSFSVAGSEEVLLPVRSLAASLLSLQTSADTQALRRMSFQVGSFGTLGGALNLAQHFGRTSLHADADFRHARNDYPFRVENGTLSHDERRQHSQSNDFAAHLSAQHRFQAGQTLCATAYYQTSHRYLPGPVLLFTANGHEHLSQQTAFGQVVFRNDRPSHRWHSFVAAKFTFDAQRYRDVNAGYAGGEQRQDYWQREWYATGGVGFRQGAFQAALSADYAFQSMNGGLPPQYDIRRHTLLGALSFRYAPRRLQLLLRLVASGYVNHCPEERAANAFRLSPSLSVSYRVYASARTRLYVRALYREALRPPTFTENYYFHYGSPRLRPETARQGGGGLTFETALGREGHLLLTADGYAGSVRDKIAAIPATLYVWRRRNIERVRTAGLDLTAEAALALAPRHRLLPAVSYTLQRLWESGGMQLAYTPEHTLAAVLTWENPWLNIGVRLLSASQRWTTDAHIAGTRLAPYADCGAFAYRTFPLRRTEITLRFDAENLGGQNYELVGRYPMPGRAFSLTLGLKI